MNWSNPGRAAAALLVVMSIGRAQPGDRLPALNVPDGFRATLYADDDLAHDIHSLTVDPQGRVVVSGPGYIRILIDSDDDGVADEAHQYADRPKTGAQGLCFFDSRLLCSGDEGLLLFADENGDDLADGPPQTFLRVSAGGEHHVHAIQQGPDGWWYVIAGNFAGVNATYASRATSPITEPIAGTLMRLTPDLSGGEIVADGFRNAYDFAFTSHGDVFTFDSDGEREVSLPWYQPTRVFHVTPLSNAGWVSRSWKRPAEFPDMPPVIAEFGRGSPTGVICYRHTQFPEPWRDAVFVLDWTMGRVLALPLDRDGASWSSEPVEFATGAGQFGFAPTDMAVGPDGSLLISVGGRGSRGGVFRVVAESTTAESTTSEAVEPPGPRDAVPASEQLDRVLRAPQPLAAWSQADWVPRARKLGRSAFETAAVDASRADSERVRAVEILTELFRGPTPQTLRQLAGATSAVVRARTAWAVGRTQAAAPDPALLNPLMRDPDPFVRRCALEALAGVHESTHLGPFTGSLVHGLTSPDRTVRKSAAMIAGRLDPRQTQSLAALLAGRPAGQLWLAIGQQFRTPQVRPEHAELAVSLLEDPRLPGDLRYDAVRLLQLALGDVGPAAERPAVYDSYVAQQDLTGKESELNPLLIRIAALFPTAKPQIDHELIRVIAMTSPFNRELMQRLLQGITDDSLPADDLHRLIAVSRFDIERSFDETTATAKGLLNVDVKIRRLGLRQDSNWDDRLGELYAELCRVDPALPHVLVDQPAFGEVGHVLYTGKIPQPEIPRAITAFVRRGQEIGSFNWSNELVFLIGESNDPGHRTLLREQLDNLAVRDAVLMVLAEDPSRDDRELFLSGLESTQINCVASCAEALTQLPRSNSAAEQFRLLAAARRLINDDREFEVRETVMRLLQNNLLQSFGFVFGKDGHRLQPDAMQAWQDYLDARFPDERPLPASDAAQRVYAMLEDVPWDNGDPDRGAKLFERLSCARCHGGRKALGPDLTGVARRFSRDDLIAAIVEPDRDVSSRYQTTTIVTTDGRSWSGLIVYESVDGLLLRDAEQNTWRFEDHEIDYRKRQRSSLMPTGLLRDITPDQLADLTSYLSTL